MNEHPHGAGLPHIGRRELRLIARKFANRYPHLVFTSHGGGGGYCPSVVVRARVPGRIRRVATVVVRSHTTLEALAEKLQATAASFPPPDA